MTLGYITMADLKHIGILDEINRNQIAVGSMPLRSCSEYALWYSDKSTCGNQIT